MPKKNVKFNLKDGMKPTPAADGVLNLRTPIRLTIKPETETLLDLGLSCDHPVQIFESAARKKAGLVFVPGLWQLQDSNLPLKVAVRNSGKNPIYLEPGDTIARCVVLDCSDIVLG